MSDHAEDVSDPPADESLGEQLTDYPSRAAGQAGTPTRDPVVANLKRVVATESPNGDSPVNGL